MNGYVRRQGLIHKIIMGDNGNTPLCSGGAVSRVTLVNSTVTCKECIKRMAAAAAAELTK